MVGKDCRGFSLGLGGLGWVRFYLWVIYFRFFIYNVGLMRIGVDSGGS